jgi:hypothetical protein
MLAFRPKLAYTTWGQALAYLSPGRRARAFQAQQHLPSTWIRTSLCAGAGWISPISKNHNAGK